MTTRTPATAASPHARPLSELLAGLSPALPAGLPAVSGLVADSRLAGPDTLFAALPAYGPGRHGLEHAEAAVERGAVAVVFEPTGGVLPPEDLGVPCLPVPGLAAKMGELAARVYGHPARQLFMAGVTGTDGKTSTAWLTAQLLEAAGRPTGYVGTLGIGRVGELQVGAFTTPFPVELQAALAGFVAGGLKAAAMEVSSHALDQERVGGIRFDAAVLTNLGRDHLDYHGTVEAYGRAKRKLFETARARTRIYNRDDPAGAAWAAADAEPAGVVLYGIGGEAPAAGRYLLARNPELTVEGLAFDLHAPDGRWRVASRLLGRFNVYNALAALAVAEAAGVPLADAVAALAAARTVPGRIEGFRGPRERPLVVVDYAHTPQALEQILRAVRAHTRGRLAVVCGCGGDRDRGKRPLMGLAAVNYADAVFFTDDNPRTEDPAAIMADILAGLPAAGVLRDKVRVIHDRAQAITDAVRGAGPDDVVVVAGKGHEDYQLYGREVRAFSDRAFVADLVGAPPPAPANLPGLK